MSDQRATAAVVRSSDEAWRALPTPGVSIKALRVDRTTGQSTALVRFEAATRFPAHDHLGGEEIFVMEGDLEVGGHRLRPSDYLYTPPNGKHAACSKTGCVFLVTLPKPVEILEKQ